MTICIAAVCDGAVGRRIIFCTDAKRGSALGSKDTTPKSEFLHGGWFLCFAGDEDDTTAVSRSMKHAFREAIKSGPINDRDAKLLLEKSLTARLAEKKSEVVRANLAMSFDDFYQTGKEKVPPEDYHPIMYEVRQERLRACFIVGGMSDGDHYLMETDHDGRVMLREDFAVIGSGAYLAQSILLLRKQNEIQRFENSIYPVYEAKRHAERDGNVGTVTWIWVLNSEGKLTPVSYEGGLWLQDQYEKHGPKDLPEMEIPDNLLHDRNVKPAD